MNILVVCHYGMYRDLSSSFVHAQAKAYAALGHRVRVVVPIAIGKENWGGKRMSSPLQKREIDGVELFLLRYLSLSKYGEKRFNTASALRAVRSHLNALLDGFAPDVIHAHTLGFDSEIGAWLKGRLHVPLVVTTHGETVCEAWGRNPVLLKTLANKADAVVSVSSMLQKQLLETHVNIKTPIILSCRERTLPEGPTAALYRPSRLFGGPKKSGCNYPRLGIFAEAASRCYPGHCRLRK